MTTLRGGTLGYAEIVALKVNRPPPPRKARHASRCRDPDGRPPIFPQSSPRCLSPIIISSLSNTARSRRRFFSSSFHPPRFPTVHLSQIAHPCYTTCVSVFFVSARRRTHPGCATGRITSSSRSLASRCLVRCFRCSVLSLVYTKRRASSMFSRQRGASLFPLDRRFRSNMLLERIYFKTYVR